MAVSTIAGIDPTVLKIREIYDRAPSSPKTGGGGQAPCPLTANSLLEWEKALVERPKHWCLARYVRPWGWVTVARFPSFGAAKAHGDVMTRVWGEPPAISHYEDGAHLRAFELLINRSRLASVARCTAEADRRVQRIDRAICEAQLWAAQRGQSVGSCIENGMVSLYLRELPEVG